MLVLTRKQQDQIQIGDNIRITVLKVKGQSVRIGIEAPKNIRVVRGELTLLEDEPDREAQSPTTTAATPNHSPLASTNRFRAQTCHGQADRAATSGLHTLVSRHRISQRRRSGMDAA